MTNQEVENMITELQKHGAFLGIFSNGEEWGIKFRGGKWIYSWVGGYENDQGEKTITLDEVKEMLKTQNYDTIKNGYLQNNHSQTI